MTKSPDEYQTPEAYQSPLEESERIALAKLLFDHIENQIKSADSKAWLTLSANGILATLFISLSKELFTKPLSKALAVVLAILMFASVLGSLFFVLTAVKPTLTVSNPKNLFYFGNIQKLPEDRFIQAFQKQSSTVVSDSLLAQVHIKARIAHRKFTMLNKSLTLFFAALVFGAISQLLIIFRS
jgi:hypothetical protein